jgi:Tol biopolymer transport system component
MQRLTGTPGATDRDPSWSPTSSTIAFWSTNTVCCPNGDVIYTVDAVTAQTHQLVDPHTSPVTLTLDPEWSTDGSKIVFAGVVVTFGYDIFVMNADGTGMTDLSNSLGDDRSPSWQP